MSVLGRKKPNFFFTMLRQTFCSSAKLPATPNKATTEAVAAWAILLTVRRRPSILAWR